MNEKKPFDDGNEFVQKHLGVPSEEKVKHLPLPLKVIKYCVIGLIFFSIITMLVAYIINFSN
ncbi:amino acid transporter [Metaplanococcus flavidus]|uniref:Amino acid transporter n=1 Tax=Metaplanococcus flavidus TaxID=569883 RepID=A0ABW3LET8_9BACL